MHCFCTSFFFVCFHDLFYVKRAITLEPFKRQEDVLLGHVKDHGEMIESTICPSTDPKLDLSPQKCWKYGVIHRFPHRAFSKFLQGPCRSSFLPICFHCDFNFNFFLHWAVSPRFPPVFPKAIEAIGPLGHGAPLHRRTKHKQCSIRSFPNTNKVESEQSCIRLSAAVFYISVPFAEEKKDFKNNK